MSQFIRQRPRTFLAIAAVLVLLAGVVGLAPRAFPHPEPTPDAAAVPPPAEETPATAVVCFGHVDVEPGVIALLPAQPGRVSKVLVSEGQAVRAGQALVTLDDRLAGYRLNEAEAAVKGAGARVSQAREAAQQHTARLAQQREAVEAARSASAAARETLARKQQLVDAGHLHAKDLAPFADGVQQTQSLEKIEGEKVRELTLHDPETAVAQAEAELAGAAARAQQARHVVDECVLRAPGDGTVLRLLAAVGTSYDGAPGASPALYFCPDALRIVRAEVAQEYADRVAVGQAAVVHNDGAETPSWKGHVSRVSDWCTRRRSMLLEPREQNDVRTLECLVTLDPGQPPLRIGQRVQVKLSEAYP
jgi:multidrug resistance efflux pump